MTLSETWPQRHHLISGRLRIRRSQLGLTQKQVVARLARIGVQTSNRALSGFEHGSGVDQGRLPELAVALDCTVTYLLGLTDNPANWVPDSAGTIPGETPPNRRPGGGPGPIESRPAEPPVDRTKDHCWILGLDVPDRLPGRPAGP